MPAPRVLITRSPHQASALADQLRALGAEPILIPTIELADPTSFAALDAALARLETFDWLIFTSANAVEAFRKRRQHPDGTSGAWPPALGPCPQVAAIGAATARALQEAGLNVDLVPPQAVAESLAEALLPMALQTDGTPTRFLLLRPEVARETLPDTLRAAGADVTIAAVYRNVIPTASIDALRLLFDDQASWPSAITFTSSSTAQNLVALLEETRVSFPQGIPRVSIGPVTSQTLRDLGYPAHAEAAEPSVSSLAAKVAEILNLK